MIKLRNIAIIAHVDHGKTTIIDSMLKQSGIFRDNQNINECAMDSNVLERERGITIFAKCASVLWQGYKINIVDTPGHADFGGEVERVLNMVDGVLLLVDSSEGPMPQTKFVLSKALALGLKPIVVVNKIDRPDRRINEVIDEILELFIALDASDEQLDFKIVYASGRAGIATLDLEQEGKDIMPIFETIVQQVPAPKVDNEAFFSMLITTREYNPYLGRLLTGRIYSGQVAVNQTVKILDGEGNNLETARITKIMAFAGLERISVENATSGDIVTISGIQKASVGDTICAVEVNDPIAATVIDPPTLTMRFSVNDSPLSGLDGNKLTSSLLKERLFKEMESNVALQILSSNETDAFEVAGRGELHLGILIETMRREGFELSIGRPKVVYQFDDKGAKLEPIEEIQVDVDEEFVGIVVQSISKRKAEMVDMRASGGGKTRLTFVGPSRGLIGYYSQFANETRGTGVMNRVFARYEPYYGNIEKTRNGVLISSEDGAASAYALWNIEERGKIFIKPGDPVYQGMIIGEHNRENDLEVNPVKAKRLSNVRASGKDEAIRLTPPIIMTLEKAISYINDDERAEITPKGIRLRKIFLDPNARKKAQRSGTV